METWMQVKYRPHIRFMLNNVTNSIQGTNFTYSIILIISVIDKQSADMDMDVDPPAFKELGTEQHLTNMSMKREDGETLTMSRELRDTTGTYSLYLDLVVQCTSHTVYLLNLIFFQN